MSQLLRRIAHSRIGHSVSDVLVRRYFFHWQIREEWGRQEFFANAFKALLFNGIDGEYAEFGSCGGTTFFLAYREAKRHGHPAQLWAFDSFEGLPRPRETDHHPRWIEGKMVTTVDEFHAICKKRGIPRDKYEVVPGFYEESLPAMSPTDPPADIALAYVDCDLHSSTKPVLDFLEPRLKQGMIVAFDDYFCWSGSKPSGERTAMLEFSARNERWEWVPYVQFGWHGMSFVIEDRDAWRPPESSREPATVAAPPT
jgi:O-methyltransferase